MYTTEDLIPQLSEWNRGGGISIIDWICSIGDFDHAIGYALLFWPNLIEREDGVFLEMNFSESLLQSCRQKTGNGVASIEMIVNHVHLSDLFGNPQSKPTEAQLLFIGQRLRELWTAKVARDFPKREIVVDFTFEPGNLASYELVLYQKPPPGAAADLPL